MHVVANAHHGVRCSDLIFAAQHAEGDPFGRMVRSNHVHGDMRMAVLVHLHRRGHGGGPGGIGVGEV